MHTPEDRAGPQHMLRTPLHLHVLSPSPSPSPSLPPLSPSPSLPSPTGRVCPSPCLNAWSCWVSAPSGSWSSTACTPSSQSSPPLSSTTAHSRMRSRLLTAPCPTCSSPGQTWSAPPSFGPPRARRRYLPVGPPTSTGELEWTCWRWSGSSGGGVDLVGVE